MKKKILLLVLPAIILLVWIGVFMWACNSGYGNTGYGVCYEYLPLVIIDGTIYDYQNTFNYYQVEDLLGDYIGPADGQLEHPDDFEEMRHLSSTVEGDVYKLKDPDQTKWVFLVSGNYVSVCGSSDERYVLEREFPEITYDYHKVAFRPGDTHMNGIITSKQELSNVIKEFHTLESYFDEDHYNEAYFKDNCLAYASFLNEESDVCYLKKMDVDNHILWLYVYKDGQFDEALYEGTYSGVFVDIEKEVLKEVSEVSVVVENINEQET